MRRLLPPSKFPWAVGPLLLLLGLTHCGSKSDPSSTTEASSNCPDDVPSSCVGAIPSYKNAVAAIVADKCLQCHGPGGVEYPQRDMTTYAKVFAQRQAMLSQVAACLMPDTGAPALTASQRATFLQYFVCGAPDN